MLPNILSLLLITLLTKSLEIVLKLSISYTLGVDNLADIYWSVVTLPDYFLALSGIINLNGVLNSKFTEYVEKSEEKLYSLYVNILLITFIYAIVISLILFISSTGVISYLFPGFEYNKVLTSAYLLRVLVPVIILKAVNLINIALLFSLKRHKVAVSMNLLSIVIIILFYIAGYFNGDIVMLLIYGNVVANFIIMILTIYLCNKKLRLKSIINKFGKDYNEIKAVLYASALTFTGVLFNQFYMFSRNYFASKIYEGALSVLYYSTTISALLVNIFYIAFFNYVLTNISRDLVNDKLYASERFTKTSLLLLSLFLPLIAVLVVCREEFLVNIYMRGNFSADDVQLCYTPFMFETMASVGNFYFLLFSAVLLSLKKYFTLNSFTVTAYVTGILFNYFLYGLYGVTGISVASVIVSVSLFITLFVTVINSFELDFRKSFHLLLPLILTLITITVLHFFNTLLHNTLISLFGGIVYLAISTIMAYLFYISVLWIFDRNIISEGYNVIKGFIASRM